MWQDDHVTNKERARRGKEKKDKKMRERKENNKKRKKGKERKGSEETKKRQKKEKAHMGAGREDSGARPPSLPNPHVYPDPNRRFLEDEHLDIYEDEKRNRQANKQHARPSTPPSPGTRGSGHCAHGTPRNRLTTQAQYV